MNWNGCSAGASSVNSFSPFSIVYNLYAMVMYLFSTVSFNFVISIGKYCFCLYSVQRYEYFASRGGSVPVIFRLLSAL